ncbi:MAG: hypothetical protein ABSA42_03185 [Terracidiphilus sp.]|jgi:hypothetical protein
MPCLSVKIVRFVDEAFPGFVECEFIDANQRMHTLVDKVPMFSELDLWKDSGYPQPASRTAGFWRAFTIDRAGNWYALLSTAWKPLTEKRSSS